MMPQVLQESKEEGGGKAPREIQLARALQDFGELFCERAGRTLRTTLLGTFVLFPASFAAWRTSRCAIHLPSLSGGSGTLRSWRLGLVRAKQSILERCAVKAPDNRVHFF